MYHRKYIFAVSLAFAFISNANSEPLLIESFESGDMSVPNEYEFAWGSNNRTSVVTSDSVVYNNREINVAIPSGRDWNAKHGDHSLRFRYQAGANMAEQRFNLGPALEELWMQYWIRVPINYYHPQSPPTNHKFLAIWMDGYSQKGDGATVIWEFWGNSDGSSRLAVSFNEGAAGGSEGHQQHQEFVSPADQGRWMEITIHLKASSDNSTRDGIIEMWRRWENEPASERKLFHQRTDVLLSRPNSGPQGWNAGYFMGWANSPYSQDTEWLLDHITISRESLLNSSGLNAQADGNAPNPPVLSVKK
jgi:hypothetical protein